MNGGLLFAFVCGLIALGYGFWQRQWILAQPDGNDRMREIAAAIQAGAKAYLNRQYTTIAMVGVVLFLVVGFIPMLGWMTAIAFAVSAVLSGLAGFIGMNVSLQANLRTAAGAKHGAHAALNIAVNDGGILRLPELRL